MLSINVLKRHCWLLIVTLCINCISNSQYQNSIVQIGETDIGSIVDMVPIGGIRGYLPATASDGTLKIYTNINKNNDSFNIHYRGSFVDIKSVFLSNLDFKDNHQFGTYLCLLANIDDKYILYQFYKPINTKNFNKLSETLVQANKILGYTKYKENLSIYVYSDSILYNYSLEGDNIFQYNINNNDRLSATYNCRLVDNILKISDGSLYIYKTCANSLFQINVIKFDDSSNRIIALNKYHIYTHAYADPYIYLYYDSNIYVISTTTYNIIYNKRIENLLDIASYNLFKTPQGWLIMDIVEKDNNVAVAYYKLNIGVDYNKSYYYSDYNNDSDYYMIDNKRNCITMLHIKRNDDSMLLYKYNISTINIVIKNTFVSVNNSKNIYFLGSNYLYTLHNNISFEKIVPTTLHYEYYSNNNNK